MKRYIQIKEDRRNVLPKYFSAWVKQQFNGIEGMIHDYDVTLVDRYYYMEDDFDENDYDSIDDYEYALYKAQEEEFYNEQAYIYDGLIDEYKRMKFPMTVYRVIGLKAKSIDDIENIDIEKEFRKGIGIYWTDGEGQMESYWSKGGRDFTVRAIIQEKDVNWKEMLVANMNPFSGEEESEITLDIGTKLILTGIADQVTSNDADFEELNVIVKA